MTPHRRPALTVVTPARDHRTIPELVADPAVHERALGVVVPIRACDAPVEDERDGDRPLGIG